VVEGEAHNIEAGVAIEDGVEGQSRLEAALVLEHWYCQRKHCGCLQITEYLFFNLPIKKYWVPHTINENLNHFGYIGLECIIGTAQPTDSA
jgi:hypothetical protein